jgi:hypothetical protein
MEQKPQIETQEYEHKAAYLEAGADYVISSIGELKELIRMINSRLVFREKSMD